jgi:hypothetical protein
MRFRDPIEWEATLPIRPSSSAWVAVKRGIYGTIETSTERELFMQLSGGVEPPAGGVTEALITKGRRSGGSEAMARIAVFEAVEVPHSIALAPGQIGVFAIICPRRDQAQEVIAYVKGLAALPKLKRHVTKVLEDEVVFKTGIAVRVLTADAVAVSAWTIVGAVRDEFWKFPGEESAMNDAAIDASLRPALAPVRGAPPRRLLAVGSAYLTEGLAYETDRDCFGQLGAPVLCLRGSTQLFNPNIDEAWLARERDRDADAFEREYECVPKAALTPGWIGAANLARSIDHGRTEPMRFEAGRRYYIAVDQAFEHDRYVTAVAVAKVGPLDEATGKRGGRITYVCMIDAITPPADGTLSVEACGRRTAQICECYGRTDVTIDQFSAAPFIEILGRLGVRAVKVPWLGGQTEGSKADKYRAVREMMRMGTLRLPDDPALVAEFANLRGKLLRGSGGERIEAARGHDDRVSAVVAAVSEAIAHPASTTDADLTWWEIRERRIAEQRLGRLLGSAGDLIGLRG